VLVSIEVTRCHSTLIANNRTYVFKKGSGWKVSKIGSPLIGGRYQYFAFTINVNVEFVVNVYLQFVKVTIKWG